MAGVAGLLADPEQGVPWTQIGTVRRLLQARTSLAYFLVTRMTFSGAPSETPTRTCLKLFPMAPRVDHSHPSAHQPTLQRALEEAASGQAPGEPDGGRVLLPGAGLAALVPGALQDGDGLE